MRRIAVLGSTGMLGSTLTKLLSTGDCEVIEYNRQGTPIHPGNVVNILDVTDESSLPKLLNDKEFDFVVNAIGLIKQHIDEKSSNDIKRAYQVNSDFPAILNEYSLCNSIPIIQIGTDCVYSGKDGNYDETSKFDCTDTYGLSKVEGENRSLSLMTIRSSIVGHEINSKASLMDWFLTQPKSSKVQGFSNHYWNGVTTLDFARIVRGVIESGTFVSGRSHLVPANQVSKFELLQIFSKEFQRLDISIEASDVQMSVNRTLSTIYPDRSLDLWTNAGYSEAPTVQEMVQNYALWTK